MNNQQLISVYIPTFNRPELLKRAVASVLAQTYPNVEILVVNDGDELPQNVVTYFDENNVRYFKTLGKQGACVARNIAIKNANGYFITGLDDDDEFTPDRLSLFMQATEQHGEVNLFSNYLYLEKNARKERKCTHRLITEELIYQGNYINNQMFAPKKYFIEAGLFDENLPAWQDYDMWIRMIQKFGAAALVEEMTYIMDGSEDIRISKTPASIYKAIEIFFNKHKAYENHQYQASIYFNKHIYFSIPINMSEFLLMFKHLNKKKVTKLLIEKFLFRVFKIKF